MAPPFRDGFEAGVILLGFIIGAVAEVNDNPVRGVLGGGAYWPIGGRFQKPRNAGSRPEVLLFNTLLNEDQPGQGGEGDEGAKNIQQVHGHVLAWEVDSFGSMLCIRRMQNPCNARR